MPRSSLAFVMFLVTSAFTAPAFANSNSPCSCESARVLPAPNSVDVPTNAHFWRLPSRTPGPPMKPYELASHSAFVVEGGSFTTGSGPDHEPPIVPSVTAASVTLSGTRVAGLHVTAATSADTAVVHLRFFGATGVANYYTTPDQLSVCDPNIELAAGHLRLDVTAIDLAGNESTADTIELDTATQPASAPRCTLAAAAASDHRAHLALAFLLGLAGIGLYLSRTNLRRRDRERTAVAPFALPAAEQLTRAVRLRSIATIALAGIATSAALHDHGLTMYAAAVSPFGAVLVIDAVVRYIAAGRVRVLLRYDGATADVQHDTVSISVGKQRAMLRATPRLVARARHHALPRASL